MSIQVRAREKMRVVAHDSESGFEISQSIQKGSRWVAFYEPVRDESMPWRINHRHANIRMSEERFEELFEKVSDEE